MFAGVISQRLSVVLSGLNALLKPFTLFLLYRKNRAYKDEPVLVFAAEVASMPPTSPPTKLQSLPYHGSLSPFRGAASEPPKADETATPAFPEPTQAKKSLPWSQRKALQKQQQQQAKAEPSPLRQVKQPPLAVASFPPHPDDAVEPGPTASSTSAAAAAAASAVAPTPAPALAAAPLAELTVVAAAPVKGGILADDQEEKAIFETEDDDVFGSTRVKPSSTTGDRKDKKAERAARREAKKKAEEIALLKEEAALEAEQARMEVQRFFAEEETRKEKQLAQQREIRELALLRTAKASNYGGAAGPRADSPPPPPPPPTQAGQRSRSKSAERGADASSKGTRARSLSRERSLGPAEGGGDRQRSDSTSRQRSGSGSRQRSTSTGRRRSGSLSRSNSLRDLRHTSATPDDSDGYDYGGRTFADAISAEVYKRSMENLSHHDQ